MNVFQGNNKIAPLDVEAMIVEDDLKLGLVVYMGGDVWCQLPRWMFDVQCCK